MAVSLAATQWAEVGMLRMDSYIKAVAGGHSNRVRGSLCMVITNLLKQYSYTIDPQ